MKIISLTLLLVLLLPVSCEDEEPGVMPTSSTQEGSVKRALLIGINDYQDPRIRDLKGPINDVTILENLIRKHYDFKPENITVLTDAKATKNRIIESIEKLIRDSDSDDVVFVHYSGHGSYMEDLDGDERVDKLDETIVPYDSDQSGSKDILDDTIYDLLKRMSEKVSNITFILDSCHSGTASRFSLAIPRIVERPEILERVQGRQGDVQADDAIFEENLDFVMFTGSQASEYSNEYHFPEMRDYFGAFTYYFVETLREAKTKLTNKEVLELVRSKVVARIGEQTPSVEGNRLDHVVFGTEKEFVEPYHLINMEGGELVMDAGAVHSVTLNSIYDVFPPDVRVFSDSESASRRLARVKVSEVSAFESVTEVIEGSFSGAETPHRAVLREHNYEALKVNVAIVGAEASPVLQELSSQLQVHADSVFAVEEVPSILESQIGAQLFVVKENDHLVIKGEPGMPLRSVVPLGTTQDPVSRSISQLEKWVRWFNIRELKPSSTALDVTMQFVTNGDLRGTALEVEEGETFSLKVNNNSSWPAYVYFIDLASDGSIDIFWPMRARNEEVSPRDSFFTPQFPSSVLYGNRDVDIIKVVVTTSPVSLQSLQQGGIRSGETGDALLKLLESSHLDVQRDGKFTPIGEWTTLEAVLFTTK